MYVETMMATNIGANTILGVVADGFKYIQTTRPELYAISSDPAEADNLLESDPKRSRMMKEQLAVILEDQVRSNGQDKGVMDAEQIRRLESIGYVAGGGDASFDFDQSRPDPKDLIDLHEKRKVAKRHKLKKEYDLAKGRMQ